jgi:hypothetical protein
MMDHRITTIDVASFGYHQPRDIICMIIEIQKPGFNRRIRRGAKRPNRCDSGRRQLPCDAGLGSLMLGQSPE